MAGLREHWNGAWRPISEGASLASDQNLGWSMALLAVLGGAALIRRRHHALAGLLIAGGALFVLLIPIPGSQDFLWQTLPAEIKSITNNWPTQRIYPVLAALILVGAGGAVLQTLKHRAHLPTWALTTLALTLIWSFAEATKFQRRARSTTVSIEESNKKLLPENIVITRYAYEMFGQKPDYVSHEFMNPRMKNWLIGARSMQVLDSNQNAARRGKPVQEFGLVRQPGRRDEYTLSPPLMLKPGIQYMLEFRFGGRNLLGELRLSGDRLDRTYKVKGSESGKFGSTVGHANSMTIWTSGNDHETVRFNYRPAGGEIPANLARVRVFEIDPKQLPVEVESMLPYRSTSRSTREAWLVTHRMFLPGYLAKVDNLPAEIRSSAEGLVMIKVPKGTAKVELRYEGPWPVKIALWVSGIAWFGLILVSTMFLIIRRMDRNTKSRLRSSSSPTVINPIDCFDSGGLRGTHSKQIEV